MLSMLLSGLSMSSVSAQNIVSEKFTIYYRFDESIIDTTYLNNSETIKYILNRVDNPSKVDSITIIAASSPEGQYIYNARLAAKRALAAKDLLLQNSQNASSLASKIKIDVTAENWQGLLAEVQNKYFRHDRDKVINILTTEGISVETRKWRLQQLDNGYTWSYIVSKYMKQLRNATWICVWEKPSPLPSGSMSVLRSSYQTLTAPESQYSIKAPVASKPLFEKEIFYVRTNLLLPLSNIGVEVPISDRISAGFDWYFPWIFRNPDNRHCFQLLGGSLEGRYWLGNARTEDDKMEGHSVGLNVGAGYYDFELDFSGKQGEFATVGVDYLYSLPICNDRLHLEFSLGLGYIYSYVRPYDVLVSGGLAFKKGYIEHFHWVGPTKATVALVLPIKISRRIGR